MKIVLLGGNGFIGTHIVDQLRQPGHDVHVYDRSQEHVRKPLKDVTYHIADFNDTSRLSRVIDGADIVYHLISTTVPSTSNLEPIRDIQENLESSVRLLQLMLDNKVNKIVFLSSGGTVYGIPEILPIPESHSLHPICSHGIVKVAIENYLHMFHKLYGLNYIILRASNPYGARQCNYGVQGVISTIIEKAIRNEVIELWGDGSIVRDFIYVEDLARLSTRVIDKAVQGIYNAGSGIGYSILEIIHIIESEFGKKLNIQHKSGRIFDVPKIVLDISKVKTVTDWVPTTSLQDGLKQTIDQMKHILR